MANSVANVGKVTNAMNGVAVAGRTIAAGLPLRLGWTTGRGVENAPAKAAAPQAVELSAPDAPAGPAPAVVTRGPITDLAELDGLLLTTNYAADTVSLLAPKSLHTVAEVADIYEPFAVAVAGRRAFISSVEPTYDTVTVLEHGAVVDRIPVSDPIRDIAVSADGRTVYAAVAAEAGAALALVDVNSHEVTTVDLAVGPQSVPAAVATGRDGIVYVAVVNGASSVLIAVRGKRILGAVAVPSMIRGMALNRSSAFVVSDDEEFGGLVDIVDLDSLQITRTIELGAPAGQVTLSADGQRGYVVNGDRVTMLCTSSRQIVDHIAVESPAAVLESADRSRLLVTDNNGGVSVFALDSADWAAPVLDAEVLAEPVRELTPA